MEYDSFSEGIELGGLRTKNEIKILIGYLLSRLDTPLTREQLDEVICGEKAFNAAVRLQTRLRRERENKIQIDRVEKGCNVTLSVVDADDEIMSVKLFVADYDQALAVKERFLEDPVRVYSNIVALLLA